MMREGPSMSVYRNRHQIILSCIGKEPSGRALGDIMLLRPRRLYCDSEAPTHSALSELSVRFGSTDSGTPLSGAKQYFERHKYFGP
jgi:hypothetical protein